MASCLVGIGSNLGDRSALVERAFAALARLPQTRFIARSSLYETRPIGGPTGQSCFLNAAALLETSLAPLALLGALECLELDLGRTREMRWAARTIDLDLLLYGDLILTTDRLTIPHPRLAWRRFALVPAAEIAAEMRHPQLGRTIGELLAQLDATLRYVAITGIPGAGTTQLAAAVADRCAGRTILDSHVEPASPSLDSLLKFLAVKRAALDRQTWPAERQLSISDFWIGQALAEARLRLPPLELAEFTAAWEATVAALVTPQLVVLIDVQVAAVAARDAENKSVAQIELDGQWLTNLRDELVTLLERPGASPLLVLEPMSPDDAVAEVVAAIESMQ